jgi:hypothetical protein
MTSDRILALMALMNEVEKPSNAYWRAVRRAAETLTDSPENDQAQARGNAALLEIDQAVRAWVAKHPEPDAITDLERARSIAVALEQENAHLTAELAEVKASNNPRLRCLLIKPDRDKDVYVGWSNVCEMPAGVWSRETAIEYGFPPSRIDRADENGSSDLSCGDGHWDDKGFVAEQRGWLRRDRLGDYAVEYLHGDRQAAYALLEPFQDETGTRQCGHDDYHDAHEWADRPGVWCPGHSLDADEAQP